MSIAVPRAFRIGLQLRDDERREQRRKARLAEEAGFDVLLVGDHLGDGWAPLLTLADLAATTRRLRLGTLVLNNDLRHPVLLAHHVLTASNVVHGHRPAVGCAMEQDHAK
jgi:alkanesulfonate monooxygenase SsuD/methylene tetrahydromethanopterin reductase-like flavin-dependent oxidoreductase (luciferase family)